MLLCLAVVSIAFLGPYASPYGPSEVVGLPYEAATSEHLLGTDGLGRDVLSRYLHGGATLILVAFAATALAYVVGVSAGLLAGLRGGPLDLGSVFLVDVLLAFPPIVLVLVLLAGTGPSLSIAVLGIAAVHAPRVFRIVRSVAADLGTREFVEAAVARGERTASILFREVLPNTWTPVLADFGIRLTGSVILFASLSYLGFGQAPPAADWGLMISEDRLGLSIQPWVVAVPAVTIAVLAVGISLVGDAVARAVGRTTASRGV